jgi:hypothetical protein
MVSFGVNEGAYLSPGSGWGIGHVVVGERSIEAPVAGGGVEESRLPPSAGVAIGGGQPRRARSTAATTVLYPFYDSCLSRHTDQLKRPSPVRGTILVSTAPILRRRLRKDPPA